MVDVRVFRRIRCVAPERSFGSLRNGRRSDRHECLAANVCVRKRLVFAVRALVRIAFPPGAALVCVDVGAERGLARRILPAVMEQ